MNILDMGKLKEAQSLLDDAKELLDYAIDLENDEMGGEDDLSYVVSGVINMLSGKITAYLLKNKGQRRSHDKN